jgi:MFS family permease
MPEGFFRKHWLLIVVVGASLMLDGLFFSALAPLLPYYISEYSLSSQQAGLFVATEAIGNLATVPLAPWAVRRWGPRRTLIGALLAIAAGSVLFVLAQSVWLLDVSRGVVGGLGTFAWAAAFTWLLRTVAPGHRARSIGIVMGSGAAGALLGPGLGALAAYAGPAAVFCGIAAANVALAALALRLPAPPAGVGGGVSLAVLRAKIDRRAAGVLAGLAWLMTMPAIVASIMLVEIPIRLDDLGFAAAAIGFVFIVSAVLDMVLAPVVGWWADRRGRLGPLRAGMLVVGVSALLIPISGAAAVVAVLAVVVACGNMLLGGPTLAMLTDRFDAMKLPYEIGFSSQTLFWAIGHSAGALGTGFLVATADWAPFAVIALLTLTTLIGLLRFGAGAGRVPVPSDVPEG